MWRKGRIVTNVAAVGGINYDSATTAWVNAVVAASGTVSTTQKGYVDTLIKGLKTDGVFSILDRLWLFGSENTKQAGIDIINLGTLTTHGSPTFSANSGYTGDGSAAYFDTGFNPSTAGGNLQQNSACIGVYDLTSRSAHATALVPIAGTDSTSAVWLIPISSDGNLHVSLNDAGGVVGAAPSNVQGLWLGSRTASNAGFAYMNGSSYSSTLSGNSNGFTNTNIFILAESSLGTAVNFTTDKIGVAFFGGGLTTTQAGNLSTRINTYATSVGFNTY